MKSKSLLHLIFLTALFFCTMLFISSCSLMYQTEIDDDEASEITLYDLVMTKVRDGKKESLVRAKQMEQYRKDEHIYARDVSFILYDKNEIIETEGWAENLKSEKDKVLFFTDGIHITSYKEDVHIEGTNIRVDTELEQLTSGKDDTIFIEYGLGEEKSSKLLIYASSIAGSGVSNTIRISGKVKGYISIDDSVENDTTEDSSESQNKNTITGDFD